MCRYIFWKEREQEGGKVVCRRSDMPSYAGLGCTLYVHTCMYLSVYTPLPGTWVPQREAPALTYQLQRIPPKMILLPQCLDFCSVCVCVYMCTHIYTH